MSAASSVDVEFCYLVVHLDASVVKVPIGHVKVKVGFTANLYDRMKDLQVSAGPLRYAAVSPQGRALETRLIAECKLYQATHTSTEWFYLPQEVYDYVLSDASNGWITSSAVIHILQVEHMDAAKKGTKRKRKMPKGDEADPQLIADNSSADLLRDGDVDLRRSVVGKSDIGSRGDDNDEEPVFRKPDDDSRIRRSEPDERCHRSSPSSSRGNHRHRHRRCPRRPKGCDETDKRTEKERCSEHMSRTKVTHPKYVSEEERRSMMEDIVGHLGLFYCSGESASSDVWKRSFAERFVRIIASADGIDLTGLRKWLNSSPESIRMHFEKKMLDTTTDDDDFSVKLSELADWLGVTFQSNLKRVLRGYVKGRDYIIRYVSGNRMGPRKVEQIMLSGECFRQVSLKSKFANSELAGAYILAMGDVHPQVTAISGTSSSSSSSSSSSCSGLAK